MHPEMLLEVVACYDYEVRSGRSVIVALRGEGKATAEYETATQRLLQCKGPHNAMPKAELQQRAQDYLWMMQVGIVG